MNKYYIDGQLVSAPLEYNSDVEKIFFDDDLRGIRVGRDDNTLTFVEDAYTLLSSLVCQGLCSTVNYTKTECCEGEEKERFSGFIRLSEVKINLQDCRAEVNPVPNNSLYKIEDRKGVEIKRSFEESFEGEPITKVPTVKLNGNFLIDNPFPVPDELIDKEVSAYLLSDVLNHALQYVTDGELTLKDNGILDNILITNGSKLRQDPASEPVCYTLEDLLDCVTKLFNVAWTVRDGQFCLESWCNLLKCSDPLPFKDIKILSITANENELFSTIKVGSNKFTQYNKGKQSFCDGTSTSTTLKFKGIAGINTWDETEIATGTECATDNTLDLTCDAIIDHNTIEDIYVRCSEEHDEDLVFINAELQPDGTYLAIQDELLTTGEIYYNTTFSNIRVLERWKCYLEDIGIDYDTLIPFITHSIIQTIEPLNVSAAGGRWRTNFGFGSILPRIDSLTGHLGGPDSVASGAIQHINYDPLNVTGYQDNLAPPLQNEYFTFTPDYSGCYRICFDVRFREFSFAPGGSVDMNAVVLEWPSLSVVGTEFLAEIGNFSGQDREAQTCVEVNLTAGTEYVINQIQFTGPSPPGFTSNQYIFSGSGVNVFYCHPNNTPGVDVIPNRNVIMEVEGIMCKQDWEVWEQNSDQCINTIVKCLCDGTIKGYIDEIQYNSCDNRFSGNLRGRFK